MPLIPGWWPSTQSSGLVFELSLEQMTTSARQGQDPHGFAVKLEEDEAESPKGYGKVLVSHRGLNDGVVEGLECLDIPAFSVQYHPEAAAGPHDSHYLFDKFLSLIEEK